MACHDGDYGYLGVSFRTAATPGSTAEIVMTSTVASSPRTATTTVEPDGLIAFILEMYQDDETLTVQSLRIGGVDYLHDFGSYTPPPLGSCEDVTL